MRTVYTVYCTKLIGFSIAVAYRHTKLALRSVDFNGGPLKLSYNAEQCHFNHFNGRTELFYYFFDTNSFTYLNQIPRLL